MTDFILDRRIIIGKFDENIPKCVIIDLASGNNWSNPEKYSYYILLRNLFETKEKLNRIPNHTIETILNASDEELKIYAPKIVSFINPDKSILWSMSKLIIAFKHMLSVINSKNIPTNFDFGPKTMEKPYSYNACMLYYICKLYKIKMNPTSSIEDLFHSINLLNHLLNKRLYIPKMFNNCFENVEEMNSCYVEFISKMKKSTNLILEYDFKNNNYDVLRPIYDKLSNTNNLMSRINIESHEEAVIIAALKFSIDITESRYPIAELDNLILYQQRNEKQYLPIDDNFRKLFERNPDWFILKKNYSPNLSMVYNDNALKSFLINEGFTQEQMNSFLDASLIDEFSKITQRELLKNALMEARINDTFYNGWHPNALNNRSPIDLENFNPKTIENVYCVTYGSVENLNNLTTYLVSELIEHFTTSMCFSNPVKIEENFSSIGINKLKLICLDHMGMKIEEQQQQNNNNINIQPTRLINRIVNIMGGTNIELPNKTPPKTKLVIVKKNNTTVDIRKERIYKNLYDIIILIEERMLVLNKSAQNLKNKYDISSEIDRKLFETSLIKLLEAGMSMRGWNVVTEKDFYPVKSVNTVIEPSLQDKVSDQVNGSIIDFENSLSKMTLQNANLIRNLSLVLYQVTSDDKLSFKESNDFDEGFTIMDRIKIVKDGEKSNNTCSCIRLSSNWLCSSAYYYIVALNLEPPFIIRDLAKIS